MAISIVSSLWSLLMSVFATLVNGMLFLTLFYSFCSYMGWIRRFAWFLIELKLSEAWNDATVTVGSLELNLVKGTLLATNGVVHTPQREAWKWESPCIARIGKIEVTWDMFGAAYQFLYLWRDPPIVDFYAIHLSDIQVFVERQQHVFNVYLLDPTLVLPDPSEFVKQQQQQHEDGSSTVPSAVPNVESNASEESSSRALDDEAEQQAQKLVHQLVSAVKAIEKGGWKGAWRKQATKLTQKLRDLQSVTSKAEYMQEGVKVITKVGKVVAKNATSGGLPTPGRRESEIPPFYCRIGRVVLKSVRVFTRQDNKWNRPIVLKEIIVRAAELCPPMSSLDEDGYPAIYQPIEKCAEVVWKRVLTEMAKSQTGRLLNTAMGEVLGIAMTNMDHQGPSTMVTSIASSKTPTTPSPNGKMKPPSPPGAGNAVVLEYRPA